MTRRRPADAPYVVWLDLETTGNRDDDKIIEIGAAVTDRDLNIIDNFETTVWPFPDMRKGTTEFREKLLAETIIPGTDPVVQRMHTVSGLWRDVARDGIALPTADAELARFVRRFSPDGDHLPLAGSGVSHFDRRYIRAQLPQSERRFAYWHYDIGVVRRFMSWWGIDAPASVAAKEGITHRALDDVHAHIAEAKAWRRRLALRDMSAIPPTFLDGPTARYVADDTATA